MILGPSHVGVRSFRATQNVSSLVPRVSEVIALTGFFTASTKVFLKSNLVSESSSIIVMVVAHRQLVAYWPNQVV